VSTVNHWGRSSSIDFDQFKRVVVWFSSGAASAIAARQVIEATRGHSIEVVFAYCDPGSEHEDNPRFIADCEKWLGISVITLKNPKYPDTWSVWEKKRYIAGLSGAPCTQELKKRLREQFEREGDIQVFGYDVDEMARAELFAKNQPEVALWCPLIDSSTPKDLCFFEIQRAGIALPTMYMLGYRNNNCIGCPKGNAGYWNKIRLDFPDVFARMAKLEHEIGARICQATINGKRQRVFLDDLPETAGRYSDEPPISCGPLCDPIPSTTEAP
jgi:hypothetical protein